MVAAPGSAFLRAVKPGACFVPAVVRGLLALVLVAASGPLRAAAADALERGAYLFHAAGCAACHTDPKRKDEPLAGGAALITPFGTFYAPNITSDPEHGIGGWTQADLVRALRHGEGPEGTHYYPVFPYTSYAGMTEQDAGDLAAYLLSVEPVARANREHAVPFPFNLRFLLAPWKLMFLETRPFEPDPEREAAWNRGRYLVEHLGHCGECHTERNLLGAKDEARKLAGNPTGPDGKKVPNVTPHPEDGIGKWSASDVTFYLQTSFRPDGDTAGGAMAEVIEESTGKLTDSDRAAIATYLRTLPALPDP